MGIERRLRRLESEAAPLCDGCPYSGPLLRVETTRIVYPDGTEDVRRDPRDPGDGPPALCDECPYLPGREQPPVRLLEVVRTVYADV